MPLKDKGASSYWTPCSSKDVSELPGVAANVAFNVPGSASEAGTDPSIDGSSSAPEPDCTDFLLRFVRALAMDEWSVGRLASWWKIVRLRMIVYTRFELPNTTYTHM